jgi:hypothetical protein
LIAARYPDRIVHVVGDAAYVGERLRDVDGPYPRIVDTGWSITRRAAA